MACAVDFVIPGAAEVVAVADVEVEVANFVNNVDVVFVDVGGPFFHILAPFLCKKLLLLLILMEETMSTTVLPISLFLNVYELLATLTLFCRGWPCR